MKEIHTMLDKIAEQVQAALPAGNTVHYHPVPLFCTPSVPPPPTPSEGQSSDDDSQYGTICYIGGESLGLTNLLLTHSSASVSLVICSFGLSLNTPM